jgi:hypothetical protein
LKVARVLKSPLLLRLANIKRWSFIVKNTVSYGGRRHSKIPSRHIACGNFCFKPSVSLSE